MAVLSDCQKTCSVTGIGGKDTIDWQGQTRLTACLSGAFCSFRLGLRQQACGSKTKNHSKIHRWQVQSSFAGAEMCPDKKRPAENTCRIVKGLDAVWAHFCPSKPCLPLSIDGNILYECVNEIGRRGCGSTTPQPPAHSSESRGGTEIDYSAFSATAASFFLARAFSSQSLPSAKRETM